MVSDLSVFHLMFGDLPWLKLGVIILLTYLIIAGFCFRWAENSFFVDEYRFYGSMMFISSVAMAWCVGGMIP